MSVDPAPERSRFYWGQSLLRASEPLEPGALAPCPEAQLSAWGKVSSSANRPLMSPFVP